MNLSALIKPKTTADWRNLIMLMLLWDVAWLGVIYLYGKT